MSDPKDAVGARRGIRGSLLRSGERSRGAGNPGIRDEIYPVWDRLVWLGDFLTVVKCAVETVKWVAPYSLLNGAAVSPYLNNPVPFHARKRLLGKVSGHLSVLPKRVNYLMPVLGRSREDQRPSPGMACLPAGRLKLGSQS